MALPPAAKLSLMDRKDIRDSWEPKKADVEARVSAILGTPWTIEVDPLAIAPYTVAADRAGQLGCIIAEYMEAAPSQLEWTAKDGGPAVVSALNAAAGKHVLSLEADPSKTYSYCGPAIRDGRLVILFSPDAVWTNINDSLAHDTLLAVIDAADSSSSALSATAQAGIAKSYEPKIARVLSDVRAILQNDAITFNPNFDGLAAALKGSKADNWEARMGTLVFAYFDDLPRHLKGLKFDSDDMLREAFAEAVTSNEIALRVGELKRSKYCEPQVDAGVLYITFPADRFGKNTSEGLTGLVEALDEAI